MKRSTGFTLLEVLVALVVFGLLMAGLSQGVRVGLRAWSMQARQSTQWSDLDAVDRTLRGLIARMDPGGQRRDPLLRGGPHAFAFTTELPQAAAAQGIARADVALGVDADHRLVLRWRPAEHVVRFAPAPPPRLAVLLDGVAALDLQYWRPARGAQEAGGVQAGAWLHAWSGRSLPALVRLHIAFADAARRWPDIVAAPARARP